MRYFCILLLISQITFAQLEYPQDYFRTPLDVPIILSGSFGELRNNHFHSGLDIKTQQREGLPIYAVADGYVSRIKVSHYGYGKTLYITHPNGYTTVYAHLKHYAPDLEAYVKAAQYKEESYEIELIPAAGELTVSQSDIVAFSGNTGSSGGPHLHFEIRDEQERVINPMLFGIQTEDTKAPVVRNLYAYTKDETSSINNTNGRVDLRLIPTGPDTYTVENFSAFGRIGFGIVSNDVQNLATNQNGLYQIKSYFNGASVFEMDFRRFSFDESRHINRFVDYEILKTKNHRIQKLFIKKNNPLSLYSTHENDGYIAIQDSTSNVYKIQIKDFNANVATINIPINGKRTEIVAPPLTDTKNQFYIFEDQPTHLNDKNVSIYIPANTFYDDTFINFNVNGDTLVLHEDTIPLRKSATIQFDVSHYKPAEIEKMYIAKLIGYKKYPSYVKTTRHENVLSAYSNTLGTYALVIDTKGPDIKPINFQDGKWLSKYRYLSFKITDDLSGISNYRATVNGKWILMEYEYKTNTLTFDFNDNVITESKNDLKLIVTDNVGNSSTFEASFFRK